MDRSLRRRRQRLVDRTDGDADGGHPAARYDRLERTVLPLWHDDPGRWRGMTRQAIGSIACDFNSQRMMRRDASEAYLR